MAKKGNGSNGFTIPQMASNKASKKKKRSVNDYLVIVIAIVVGLLILVGIISANVPRNYYLKGY
jgi:uncharacterized membrane protein